MKITIITATRNNASTIGKTIESVINQTHPDIDYIIIDGASTDNSIAVISHYQQLFPDKIRFLIEPDSGVYNAINKGIATANGEIIGTLHGNDRFTSPYIIEQVAKAMESTDIKMVYGDVHYTTLNGDKTTRYYSAKDFTPDMLKIGIAPPHPSLYLRREIFERYGLYKEDYLIGADFEMFIRLMLIHRIKGTYLPLDMVTMTTGGLSTRLYHRIFTNNREKRRALKENSIPIGYFSLLKRYLYTPK